MRQVLLIFSFSVLILLLGLFIGYKQFRNEYSISERTRDISSPLELDLDTDFIRKRSF